MVMRQAITSFSLFILTISASHYEHVVEKTCTDLSCASRESLLSQISILKKDVMEAREILLDSECTACFSDPCQNGGSCLPDGKIGYRCECTEDTAGDNCEKLLTCEADTCGKNAKCFIQNHQINCACDLGYSGNPWTGCNLATRKICFSGDPHYNTFDGGYFNYMATCPYVFSMPCDGELEGGYSTFSVKAKNDIQTAGATVSMVTSTQVEFYNQTIYVDRNLNVFVNGVKTYVPYYYPTSASPKFTITLSGGNIIIKNDQFVQVDFQYSVLCLTIPDVPEFRGAKTLCGLAGNLDGDCTDDYVMRNGIEVGSSCRPVQADVDEFADTWRTDDYTLPSPAPACMDGWTMTNKSATCNVQTKASLCQDIDNARTGTGPFAVCQILGDDAIQRAYDSCIYDVCLDDKLKCSSFADFVSECQFASGGVIVHNWRANTNCPMNCPAHTTYDECVSACPATCAEHDAPGICDKPCSEGCECDYGYVLDTTSLSTVTCIPVQECGCTDDDGNMHPADTPWLTDECALNNYCQNGTYFKEEYDCQADSDCGILNGELKCRCNGGYQYNSTTGLCDDIDECLDPASCSAGNGFGVCVNTPGSYYCECEQYYVGHDCEEWKPNRHCADLMIYHNTTEDGAYSVTVPVNGSYGDIQVYCDMTRGDGGWTLIANSLSDETADKTLDQYAAGFGSAENMDLWFGLDLLSLYTNYQRSSLRLNLFRCARNGVPSKWTDCTYPLFSVSNREDEYRVTIPKGCQGTEQSYYDGWARWDLSETGPKFTAIDNDDEMVHCSASFRNTGWWFDTDSRCGSANLNGVRYSCDNQPNSKEIQSYLFWGGDPLNQADMYIRPADFPDYD